MPSIWIGAPERLVQSTVEPRRHCVEEGGGRQGSVAGVPSLVVECLVVGQVLGVVVRVALGVGPHRFVHQSPRQLPAPCTPEDCFRGLARLTGT